MESIDPMDYAVTFLTGAFAFSAEFQNVGMAIQGAMSVRKGPNKEKKLHWFHAFMLSVVAGFAGGIFNFIWMGKPSGIIANDLAMGSCIIAFALVNILPFDLGFMFFNTFPLSLVIVSSAQLFRSLGLVKFVSTCFMAFKDTPSAYYPIPVFGPIIYGTLLGNMGPLFMKGFEPHIGNGVPWPVQNGLFLTTFYHFYVHDKDGPIGQLLRTYIPVPSFLGLDDATFATAFVSLFMQIMGILQMPEVLGPSFSPFGSLLSPFKDTSTWNVGKGETVYAKKQKEVEASARSLPDSSIEMAPVGTQSEVSKKKKKKKKNKTSAAVTSKEKEL